MTARSPIVVVKLGGSLLTLPDWPSRLAALLQSQPDVRPLLIVGGGAIVEEIRRWDALFSLGEETCHQLALDAMGLTAGLAARLVPRAELVADREAADACWSRDALPVLWELHRECRGLPRRWTVTSDSLAAEVARQWSAEELWLLKSADWPPGISLDDASRQGLLDRHFPALDTDSLKLKWCNLRSAFPDLRPLNAAGRRREQRIEPTQLETLPVLPPRHD